MATRLTFLGTSTSVGVPVIGCQCQVCTSSDPRNTRTRSSIFIQTDEVKVLVDTGPDLREQALREGLTEADHVLYTHDHVDHVVGFDEIRAFCWRRPEPLPIHGSAHTLATLERMFPWAFGNTAPNYVRPDARPFEDFSQLTLGDLEVLTIPVQHGISPTHGFIFTLPTSERIAYLPDVKVIPPASLQHLQELDLLIIDALRHEPHPSHMSWRKPLPPPPYSDPNAPPSLISLTISTSCKRPVSSLPTPSSPSTDSRLTFLHDLTSCHPHSLDAHHLRSQHDPCCHPTRTHRT